MSAFSFKEIKLEGIGTHWWIDIYDDLKDSQIDKLYYEINNIIQTFDDTYSRFKDYSFVSILNNEKKIINFPKELFEMFSYCENIRELTDGHFNAGVGKRLESLGYDKNYSFKSKVLKENILESPFEILNENEIKIKENSRVDLGGIGKGWLIDKIKEYLYSKNIKFFIINGGGDIYASTLPDGSEIEFYLENPFADNEMIGTINIKNSSIAASGTKKRQWKDMNTNKVYHHLIDAVSGENIQDIVSVFTSGKNALETDSASTAIFVSPTNLREKIEKSLNIEFLIIFANGSYKRSKGYNGVLNS